MLIICIPLHSSEMETSFDKKGNKISQLDNATAISKQVSDPGLDMY